MKARSGIGSFGGVATIVDRSAHTSPANPARRPTDLGGLILRYALSAALCVVVLGAFLRFFTSSALWLDEALSVNIAKLPVAKIPGALRHDGAPPLYYVLLHFWMRMFGRSDLAVRSLSGFASLVTLPVAYVAGRRLGGRAGAWASVVLISSSPFAIEYATSARMYSFMILWSLLGFLALARAIEQPTHARLGALGGATALALYTHYWSLYLLGVVGLWLLWQSRARSGASSEQRGAMRRCFVAMAVGAVTFVPWLPSFVFQSLHTGTPWSNAAGPGDIVGVLGEYSGTGPWGTALGLTLFTLLLLGLFGRSIDGRQVLLRLRTRRRVQPLAIAFFGTLVVAVACGAVAQAAFVGRYTAVVFPLFILLIGFGATVFADRRVLAVVLAWTCLCGLMVSIGASTDQRTEANLVASWINRVASPGDLVVYCPDQHGPAASRLIHVPVEQATFPRAASPERVDWVDYRSVIARTNVQQFAVDMINRAAGHDLWLVWRAGYPGTDGKCSKLYTWLQDLRSNGQELVHSDTSYYEHEALVRFPE